MAGYHARRYWRAGFFAGWLYWLGCVVLVSTASAQVEYFTSSPNIDSFPIVRVGVSVTDNGKPATTVDASNYSITEDGYPVTNLELTSCDGASSAAIAVVLDASQSMYNSAGTGTGNYSALFRGFSSFLSRIPAPSELALIPFTDTVA